MIFRGKDYKARLLILNLQRIVSRKTQSACLWENKDKFENSSQEWLQYYETKSWIEFRKSFLKGFKYCHHRGVEDVLIVRSNFVKDLKRLRKVLSTLSWWD